MGFKFLADAVAMTACYAMHLEVARKPFCRRDFASLAAMDLPLFFRIYCRPYPKNGR